MRPIAVSDIAIVVSAIAAATMLLSAGVTVSHVTGSKIMAKQITERVENLETRVAACEAFFVHKQNWGKTGDVERKR